MLIFIEPESEKPIYQQLRDQIVEGIARGELPPGTGLPSIRQLAADFGINLHTVNKAYELLEREGFLQVRRKTGAVVQPTGRLAEDWEARLRTLLAEALAQGVPAEEILTRCQRVLTALADHGQPHQ
uniref:GntR family transcriptional regulator n=1 Tax=Thermogemmatispora argillosa TaxID=2045280 RepID=A0A455T4Z0_9CHLR|nr:GntR family transcriptional regulator [Thermogemmatispora argillosa]